MIKLSTQTILVKNRETHEFEPIDNIGLQGESLYEIAVKEGFTGTKQEFLDSFQVVVSDEQPTSDYNKIWLDETSEDVEVPSIEEFNELKNRVDEIPQTIFQKSVDYHDFGLAWIMWTNDLKNGFDTVESAITALSKHDIIATQTLRLDKTASQMTVDDEYTADSYYIMAKAKEINPKLKRIEYIQSESERIDFEYEGEHAYLNSDGSWEGSTAQLSGCTRIYNFEQLKEWFAYFKRVGADGVFFDDWGYDWSIEHICWQMGYDTSDFSTLNDAINKKWSDLIDACHDYGLCVITNGGWAYNIGDWYTHLNENDIISIESCMVSSDAGKFNNGQIDLYNYYKNWYSTGKCKAKIWSQDYLPVGCYGDFLKKIQTYEIAMALACGANYVSSGVSKCLEVPFFVEPMTRNSTRNITQISSYIYKIQCDKHYLEVYRNPTVSGTLTEEMIDTCYCNYDGSYFINAYLLAPMIEKTITGRISTVENIIDTMTEDTRKNASSYWRMAIDDWHTDNVLEMYSNMLVTNNYGVLKYGTNAVFDGDITNFTITYSEDGWHGVTILDITISDTENAFLRGKEIEIGSLVYDATYTPSNPAVSITTVSGEKTYQNVSNDVGNSVLKDNKTGLCLKFTIPQDCTRFALQLWDAWINSTSAGTLHCENLYMIDIHEHDDEIAKTWYTNEYHTSFNTVSAVNVSNVTTTKYTQTVFNSTFTVKDPWGWCAYAFPAEDVINMRGKTYEFGCSNIFVSDGSIIGRSGSGGINLAFGIGINSQDGVMPNPRTYRIYGDTKEKSVAWDEDMYCFSFTVPETATYLCVGFQSYGFPVDTVITAEDIYLYDLDEDVAIRGKTKTNASLRLCRVTDEQESLTPSKLTNSLYFSDTGRIWSYDLAGNRKEIAGAIFIGAVNAGYSGTPEEFGAALAGLILG